MKESHWRITARQVIGRVIAQNPELSGERLRAAVSDAYPFGPRAYYPYKIWLSEVNLQLGRLRPKPVKVSKEQLGLF